MRLENLITMAALIRAYRAGRLGIRRQRVLVGMIERATVQDYLVAENWSR